MTYRSTLGSLDRVFRGGGSVGALMRAYDWPSSPLGAVEKWPQSLRTAISILLETSFPMYVAWGNDFIQFYNDGYRPILGGSKHPGALGNRARETFAESWHIIGPMFDNVMRGVTVGSDDWMLPLDRNGYLEECYFTYSYSPIRAESGEVGGVLVTVSETTGRVLGERRLRCLSHLSAGSMQAGNEAAIWPAAVELLRENAADLPFTALYFNEAGGSVLSAGSAPAEEMPVLPREVGLPGRDPSPLAAALRSSEATVLTVQQAGIVPFSAGLWPEPITTLAVVPISQPHRDQPRAALVVGVSPRRALDNDYLGFLRLVAVQISTALTRVLAYETERERAEALAEIDRVKTVFFSNVSHEFRTPLTLMLGNLEEARLDSGLSPSAQERVQVLNRSALRLLKLVNTLLDFSRIEAGRVDAVYEPTDLATLTADLAGVFRSAIERAGLRLVVDCPPLPEPIYVDNDMWEKIVLNLLSNALKFTFAGEISVRLRLTDGEARLTIADTGIGIQADEQARIFERFHRARVERARTDEGTGIGLALVRELVGLHRGRIEVESEIGKGSRFTVTIPAGKAHLPPEQIGTAGALNPTAIGSAAYVEEALRWLPDGASAGRDRSLDLIPGPPGSGARPTEPLGRVLVVDDNADMRDYLYRLLSPAYEVRVAADGAAALALAALWPPDLVLADVMMPGGDGFELLRALRTPTETQAIPLILLSARAGEESRVEGLERGADDYLVKPFSARELLARVGGRLELAQMRTRIADHEREHLDRLQQLAEAALDIHSTLSLQETLDRATTHAREIIGAHMAVTSVATDDRAGSVVISVALSDKYAEWRGYNAQPDGTGIYALVRQTNRPMRLTQAELIAHPAWRGFGVEAGRHPPMRGWLAAPLIARDGRNLGVIQLSDRYEGDFSAEDEAILVQFAHLASVAVENAHLYDLESTARAQAEKANALKLQFLAMISHELRTPLASIKGFLSTALAEDIVWDAAQLREFLTIADEEADRLTELIEQLLDVSRIQAGTFRVRPEPEALVRIVRAMLPTLHHLDSIRRLIVDVPEDLPLIRVDADRVAQVIYNLIGNAAKYSESDTLIRLSARVVDGFVQIEVSDDGEGIPEPARESVFEVFRQLDERSRRGGAGLGLAICKGIVDAHGGRIWIQERSTPGTTIAFTLPLA